MSCCRQGREALTPIQDCVGKQVDCTEHRQLSTERTLGRVLTDRRRASLAARTICARSTRNRTAGRATAGLRSAGLARRTPVDGPIRVSPLSGHRTTALCRCDQADRWRVTRSSVGTFHRPTSGWPPIRTSCELRVVSDERSTRCGISPCGCGWPTEVERLQRMSDEEFIPELRAVPGVGRGPRAPSSLFGGRRRAAWRPRLAQSDPRCISPRSTAESSGVSSTSPRNGARSGVLPRPTFLRLRRNQT